MSLIPDKGAAQSPSPRPPDPVPGGGSRAHEGENARARKPAGVPREAGDQRPAGDAGASGDPPASVDSGASGDPPASVDSGASGDPPASIDSGASGDPPTSVDSGASGDPPASTDSGASADPPGDPAIEPAPPAMPLEAEQVAVSRAGIYARLVAAGILLSRIAGLIRQRVQAHYFGDTLFADAFYAAIRIPNIVQNLLGEGTLSASFIPVYAELVHQGRKEDAGRVAGATFSLLLALAGAISLLGIFFAPQMVDLLAIGFTGERRELTTAAVRIIFPMTGVLVLSAWALGILNSHRSFFLSYVAPVVWNVAIIAAFVAFAHRTDLSGLVIAASWGALVGGILQFAVQLPRVLRLQPGLRIPVRRLWSPHVREVVRNAGPAILGRGVAQLSGYVDLFLASLLSQGAVAAMGYAMTLYLLPISLFGMSVAASELPELARQRLSDPAGLAARVSAGLRQIAVFVVPSAVGYVLLGDVIVAALYQTGRFGRGDTIFVYIVLVGFTLGLLATTGTRLFSSAFFALHDTKTPAKIAFVRVVLTGAIGYGLMMPFERHLSFGGHPMGALGLTLGAGVAAWVEWASLKRVLRKRIGPVGAGGGPLARMFLAALAGAAVGRGIAYVLPPIHYVPWPAMVRALLVLGPFGVTYFLLARALGVAEAGAVVDRVVRRLRR